MKKLFLIFFYFIIFALTFALFGCNVSFDAPDDSGKLYKEAVSLMEKGKYKEAADIFGELKSYSQSARYYWECIEKYKEEQYDVATDLYEKGKIQEAYDTFASLDYKDSTEISTLILKDNPDFLKEGNYISFGTFEQDDNEENGPEPIEWLVLKINKGKALVIAKNVLYSQNYTDETKTVTWEYSLIRDTLNNAFYRLAFSDTERSKIDLTTVVQHENSEGSCINPGDKTYDFIFLLSEKEACDYFKNDVSRVCKATPYAKSHGCYTDVNLYAWWRLRTPGTDAMRYVDVNSDGSIFNMGIVGNTASSGIRPAMWIKYKT